MRLYWISLVVIVSLIAGCDSSRKKSAEILSKMECGVKSYENFAYEFDCTHGRFIHALIGFLSEHNDLKIAHLVATPPGYLVIFRQKTDLEDVAIPPTTSSEFRVFLGDEHCATLPINTPKPVNLLDLCSSK